VNYFRICCFSIYGAFSFLLFFVVVVLFDVLSKPNPVTRSHNVRVDLLLRYEVKVHVFHLISLFCL